MKVFTMVDAVLYINDPVHEAHKKIIDFIKKLDDEYISALRIREGKLEFRYKDTDVSIGVTTVSELRRAIVLTVKGEELDHTVDVAKELIHRLVSLSA